MLAKKTVASVKSTFTKMITDLKEIESRENARAAEARKVVKISQTEATAAAAFSQGLGKLLAGE